MTALPSLSPPFQLQPSERELGSVKCASYPSGSEDDASAVELEAVGSLEAVYDEIVHWRKDFFAVPNNSAGKTFVKELAERLQNYVNSEGKDGRALFEFAILPTLMLQKPTLAGCGYRETTDHLRRRLDLWDSQDLLSLVDEGRCIQKQYSRKVCGGHFQGQRDPARQFGLFMATGRVHQALRVLKEEQSDAEASGVLHMEEAIKVSDGTSVLVKDILREKHPSAQKASPDILIEGEIPRVNTIRFEALSPNLLQRVSLHCQGSAGPSGLNANAWRRLCSSFKGASTKLCQSLANLARLLATQEVDPSTIAPFMACRLIALDKRPGVRPIGVCEVARRIVAKAILRVLSDDIEEACGYLQKCSGLPAGLEAAVHAMQQLYEEEATEGILLVDAKNAFNNLNREAALHNVQYLCPALHKILHNCYQAPCRLFVSGGGELQSEEGTTQGDPLSMPFYALAVMPLIQQLQTKHSLVRQIWLADDSAGVGRLRELRRWWDTLCAYGERYGYFTNGGKTFLLVKANLLEEARELFKGTQLQITTKGARYLGSAIGEPDFVRAFLKNKVQEWKKEIELLSEFARTEPHAAFAALTHGLRGRYTFLLRTLPTDDALCSLDDLMVQLLLPAMMGRARFSEEDIALLRLPARLGGIGLPHFSAMAPNEFSTSRAVTKGQVVEIVMQNACHDIPTFEVIHKKAIREKNAMKHCRRKQEVKSWKDLMERLGNNKRQVELLSAKGSSSWLTALPLKDHGFWLSKRDFRDAMALRYGWQLEMIPMSCVCGNLFNPDHAMVCTFGGYPTIRHNELRDIIGRLASEVCHNVAIEPQLQPLNGEVFKAKTTTTSPAARADIRMTGFWTRQEDAFFDIRVCHVNAPSYLSMTPKETLEHHERLKRLEYEERVINVDHGSFCPLVFSTTGATGQLCDRFLKRLGGMIAEHDQNDYSTVMAWLRCRISFALLRSAVMCIRGSRSSHRKPVHENRNVSIAEGRILEASQ